MRKMLQINEELHSELKELSKKSGISITHLTSEAIKTF